MGEAGVGGINSSGKMSAHYPYQQLVSVDTDIENGAGNAYALFVQHEAKKQRNMERKLRKEGKRKRKEEERARNAAGPTFDQTMREFRYTSAAASDSGGCDASGSSRDSRSDEAPIMSGIGRGTQPEPKVLQPHRSVDDTRKVLRGHSGSLNQARGTLESRKDDGTHSEDRPLEDVGYLCTRGREALTDIVCDYKEEEEDEEGDDDDEFNDRGDGGDREEEKDEEKEPSMFSDRMNYPRHSMGSLTD